MYFKGALFLHTLRSVVDDDTRWRALVRGFYDRFKYQTILTEDVVQFFNQETGKDLTAVFDEYLRQPGVPTLELRFDEPAGTVAYRWRVSNPRFTMPIRVGRPDAWQVVTPTTEWTIMPWTMTRNDFEVATDLYYVYVDRR
jgi:aminopeptidase N